MVLIVGLGNPGGKYEKTRHNVGFRIIDEFKKKNNFPDFNFEKKFDAETSEDIIDSKKIILAKSQTLMNNSGQTVKKLMDYNKLQIDNLWVINDDIDISLGNIKISKESGSAGHKGVESIIDNLKSKDFIRLRIGIQPQKGKSKNIEKFVLQKFNKEEEKILSEIIPKVTEAIEIAIKDGTEKAMNLYN